MIIIIAFFSLIALIIIHELGHFLLAKKFGIKVEEFGIGIPPRIFGKKIGETIYSINLLPLGGFVKLYGHEKRETDPDSFSSKPIWQRALVILGGVVSFWIVAAVLLSIVVALGVPTVVGDEEAGLTDPKVQIVSVSKDSPAEQVEIKIGDMIRGINDAPVSKVKEVQEITQANKGKEMILTIQRGKEVFNVSLVPRESFPAGDGAMGVGLMRIALKSYPWYLAPFKGIIATGNLTLAILDGWVMTLSSLFQGNGMPQGVEVSGIVGIFELFVLVGGLGLSYFLQFIAIIAISLALINALPIPALDGGWLAFLLLEKIRGKPVKQKTEQVISSVFFVLLIALMIWINVRDIIRIF